MSITNKACQNEVCQLVGYGCLVPLPTCKTLALVVFQLIVVDAFGLDVAGIDEHTGLVLATRLPVALKTAIATTVVPQIVRIHDAGAILVAVIDNIAAHILSRRTAKTVSIEA